MDERSCPNAARAAKVLVAWATTLRCECNQTATERKTVKNPLITVMREIMLQQ
jgi:hypothetical protein